MNSQNLRPYQTAFPYKADFPILSPDSGKQLLLWDVSCVNNSGSAINIGIGHSICSGKFKFWTIGATTVEVTDFSVGISIFPTTNNYGFLAQAQNKFNMLVFNLSQAETGSPVYTYEYWNGSAWSTLSLEDTPDYSATGKSYIVFLPPFDWMPGDGTVGGDPLLYSIRALGTTAPTAAVTADSLYPVKFIVYRNGIANNQWLQTNFFQRQLLLEAEEALFTYFSTADAANIVEVAYQMNP